MLEEEKRSFYENANLLPFDWQQISRSELCRMYVQNKDTDYADSYLSAIIYKFWNVVNHNYYTQLVKIATPEDCLQWNVDSILYVLERHVWDDPQNNLYKDENAPEKAINVAIVSAKVNFFIAQKRDKRKIHQKSYSLEAMQENTDSDYMLPSYSQEYSTLELSLAIKSIVKKYFEEFEYIKALLLYFILENPQVICKEGETTTINTQAFIKLFNSFSESKQEQFSDKFDIPLSAVNYAVNMLKSQEICSCPDYIKEVFIELQNDQELREIY